MNDRMTAAKKPLALTLALALGLSLPGGAAWSQVVNVRVAPAAPAAGVSAAAASAATPVSPLAAGLSAAPLSAPSAPALSAPAAAPAALAASPAAAAPSAASAAPAPAPALRAAAPRAAAPARAAAAPSAAPAAVGTEAAASVRAQLESAGAVLPGEVDVRVTRLDKTFDGSSALAPEARVAPAYDTRGYRDQSHRPILLKPSTRARASAPAAANSTQQRMLATLYQVGSIFAERYAPLDMKKERFALDLKREYDKAKAAILADPHITTREFQDLLAKLVAAMRDYHVSISFHSTESSKLPFSVMGAEGKYYLAYVDREKLPLEKFPFETGDELVGFDGVPTAQAVKAIADKMTGNTPETDRRMAEMFLTNRRRARGDKDLPRGAADLVFAKDGALYRVRMGWDYTPELVAQDVPLRNPDLLEPAGDGAPSAPATLRPAAGGFLNSVAAAFSAAVHPLADLFASIRAEANDNAFMIGARRSFVPELGKVLWRSDEDSHFDAYVFETNDGRKMGYVRIAAYDGDNEEVREFAALVKKFQAETDGLVIDQVSNPGGNVFYLYALASHLTDKPLVAPRHHLIIGEAEAHQSAELLLKVMRQQKSAKKEKPEKKRKLQNGEEEEPNASGYPITGKFMAMMVRSAQFILQQFNAGKRYTDLIHVGGVADIDPAPKPEERYTKPILLLTNALDFSGGDFFPAIMQDNGRATILGVRTAGAGGIVKPYAVSEFGIDHLSATGSLAERPNGKPIENLGVTPDIPYEITAKDLKTGFAEYRFNILKALRELIDGKGK